MKGSQGIEDHRRMKIPMVAKARNSRYKTRSKVPSKWQVLAHMQSPTTDAAAPQDYGKMDVCDKPDSLRRMIQSRRQ